MLGTPALLLVAPVVKKVPVVFGLVANPYFTGAAYEPAHPALHQENVTGIYTPAPRTRLCNTASVSSGRVRGGSSLTPPTEWPRTWPRVSRHRTPF